MNTEYKYIYNKQCNNKYINIFSHLCIKLTELDVMVWHSKEITEVSNRIIPHI